MLSINLSVSGCRSHLKSMSPVWSPGRRGFLDMCIYLINVRGARRIFLGLKFQFLVSLRGSFFASSLKSIMVSFRVPNFHDLVERQLLPVLWK